MSPCQVIAMIFWSMLFSFVVAPISAIAAEDALVVTDCNYGDVYQFTTTGCTASLENKGATPLTLSIESVQPGNEVTPSRLTLEPHARADIALHVSIENVTGSLGWTYRIDGAGKESHFVRAVGFVSSVLDIGHPVVEFGQIDASRIPMTKTILLGSSVDSTFRVSRIVSQPSSIRARVGEDARSLLVEVASDAPWGPFDGPIKVALESSLQKQVWIEVSGSVTGAVGPDRNPYWVGEITWAPEITLFVPLIDSTGRDFAIGAVESRDLAATYENKPCEPPRSGCRNLVVHMSGNQPSGLLRSHIDVELADRKKHLNVVVWGVVGERPKPGEPSIPPRIAKIPLPISQDGDLVSVTPPLKVQADPPGTGPLLKWTIGEQTSVHGYQILRGNSANGPFTLMDPPVIPKIDNGKGPVAYRWRDTSAIKGRTYWYYIAVLYTSGDRRPLSQPQETVAK
jgi:hypothetical protein